MTRGEILHLTAREDSTPSKLRNAVQTGRLGNVERDGAGNFKFDDTHLQLFKKYLADPPPPGPRPVVRPPVPA